MERSMEGAVGTFYGGGSGNVALGGGGCGNVVWRGGGCGNVVWRGGLWKCFMEEAVEMLYGGGCGNVLWRGLCLKLVFPCRIYVLCHIPMRKWQTYQPNTGLHRESLCENGVVLCACTYMYV